MSKKKKRFKRLKKFTLYFFIFLLIVYIFRVPLLSGPICWGIEKGVASSIGVKIEVEKFSGTYFTSLAIDKIKLKDGGKILDKCRLDKFYVSYNPLALIFGGRIVTSLHIKNVDVRVIGLPKFAKKKEPKKQEKASEPLNVLELLKQIPQVKIQNISLAYKVKDQDFSLKNFNLSASPKKGNIEIEKISAFTPLLGREHKLKTLQLQWNVKDKKLIIKKAKGLLQGYNEEILQIQEPFSINLKDIGKYPMKFDLPLPGGVFSGKATISEGLKIRTVKMRNDLGELFQIFSFLKGKKLKKCKAGILLQTDITWPKWNIEKLQGRVALKLCRDFEKEEFLIDKETPGLNLSVSFSDLSVISDIMKVSQDIDKNIKPVNISGNLLLKNNLKALGHTLHVKGSIESKKLLFERMPLYPIDANWDISTNNKEKQILLKNINFDLARLKTHVHGNIDLQGKEKSQVHMTLHLDGIKKQLETLIKKEIPFNANVKTTIDIEGKIPGVKSKTGDFTNNLTLDVKKMQLFQGEKITNVGDILLKCKTRMTMKNKKGLKPSLFTLNFLQLLFNKEKIIDFSGSSQLDGKKRFDIGGKITLKEIGKKLKKFAPGLELDGKLDGDIALKGDMESKNPKGSAIITINLRNIQFQDMKFEHVKLFINIHFDEEVLTIKSVKIDLNRQNLITLGGKFHSRTGVFHYSIHSKIDGIENIIKHFITEKDQIAGDLDFTLKGNGKIPLKQIKEKADIQKLLKHILFHSTLDLHLCNMKQKKEHIPNLSINGKLLFQDMLFQVEKFLIKTEEKKLCYFSHSCNLKNGKSSIKFALRSAPVRDYLAKFVKQDVSGDVALKLSGKGILPLPFFLSAGKKKKTLKAILDNTNWKTRLGIKVKNISLEKKELPGVKFVSNIHINPNKIKLYNTSIALDRDKVLEVDSTLSLKSQKQAFNLAFRFESVKKYFHTFFPQEKINGKIWGHYKTRIYFPLDDLIKNNFHFDVKDLIKKLHFKNSIKFCTQDVIFRDTLMPNIKFYSKIAYKKKRFLLSPIQCLLDKKEILRGLIRLNLDEKKRSSYFTRIKLDNIASYIQKVSHFTKNKELEKLIQSGDFMLSLSGGGHIPVSYITKKKKVFTPLSFLKHLHWNNKIETSILNLQLKKKKFPNINIVLSKKIHGLNFTIDPLDIVIDNEKLIHLIAKIQPSHKKESSIVCHMRAKSLKTYLEKFLPEHKDKIDGEFKLMFDGKGKLPLEEFLKAPKNIKRLLAQATWNHNFLMSFRKAKLQVHDKKLTWEDFHIKTSLFLKNNILQLTKCYGKFEDTFLFKILAKLDYEKEMKTRVSGSIPLSSIVKKILPLLEKSEIVKLPLVWKNKSEIQFLLHGTIPTKKKAPLDLALHFDLPFEPEQDGTFWNIKFNDLSLIGKRKKKDQRAGLAFFSKIHGTLKNPKISSHLLLRQDIIRAGALKLLDLETNITIDNRAIIMLTKSKFGGGELEIKSQIGINKAFFPEKFQVLIKGKRLLLIRTDDLYGRSDIAIGLAGNITKKDNKVHCKAALTGNIDILNFEVTKQMSLESSPERASSSYVGADIPGLDLDLDLKINLSHIVVQNNLADIRTQGTISVKGTAKAPKITGWIRTTSGKLFLPQGTMNITECLIRLKEDRPLVPNINIIAESQVQSYQVIVTIKGTPDNLEILFSSVPPLPQEDVVSLLLTGATRSEFGKSGGRKMQETGSFILLQQLLNSVGIGTYVSAQVTDKGGAVTVNLTPNTALQGKVDNEGRAQFNFVYKFRFK